MSHRPDHHAPGGGFRNPWPLEVDQVPFGRALRWALTHRARAGVARRPTPIERRRREDFEVPVPPGTVRATWMGHSAVLLQYAGATVFTDPMLGRRASPLPLLGPARETPVPVDRRDLPMIDVVVLSHNHYDHLDRGSVKWLHRRDRPLFICPPGVGAHLRGWLRGVRVVELDWGESADLDAVGLRIHATPACHFSRRTLSDGNRALWASFYLEPLGESPSVYFAGDSGYAPHFADVRERHGAPDLALMPIGAYEPRWIMKPVHLNPEEAVRASLDVGARIVLGTHWGTFILTDEPMDEPPARFLAEAARLGLAGARVVPVGGMLEVTAGAGA